MEAETCPSDMRMESFKPDAEDEYVKANIVGHDGGIVTAETEQGKVRASLSQYRYWCCRFMVRKSKHTGSIEE